MIFNTTSTHSINVQRCIIAWSLKNVRKGVNDKILVDSVEKTIPEGYYTFSELKEAIKKHDVTVDKTKSNHVTATGTKDFSLQKLGSTLLGFDEKLLAKNTTHESNSPASMTNGIKDIHVYSNLVDACKNFSYGQKDVSVYNRSTLLLVVPIDTLQSLNGTFTEYNTSVSLPCRSDIMTQEVIFIVESGGHLNDYETFILTIELK